MRAIQKSGVNRCIQEGCAASLTGGWGDSVDAGRNSIMLEGKFDKSGTVGRGFDRFKEEEDRKTVEGLNFTLGGGGGEN
jgi:hypothetical protein